MNSKKSMLDKFNEYDQQNPHIYELFKKFTFVAIQKGFKHFSTEMIINQIRWYTAIETSGDVFKVNNNYKAYYSRKFATEFPIHKNFFRYRSVKIGI